MRLFVDSCLVFQPLDHPSNKSHKGKLLNLAMQFVRSLVAIWLVTNILWPIANCIWPIARPAVYCLSPMTLTGPYESKYLYIYTQYIYIGLDWVTAPCCHLVSISAMLYGPLHTRLQVAGHWCTRLRRDRFFLGCTLKMWRLQWRNRVLSCTSGTRVRSRFKLICT